MCGDSGFDEDIDSILIDHPDRVPRVLRTPDRVINIDLSQFHEGAIYLPSLNDIDLADAYVPFDPSTESTEKEEARNCGFLSLLVVGLMIGGILLAGYVANGNAIPPAKAFNYSLAR